MPKLNYTAIVNGKRYESSYIRRFLTHVRTINWKVCPSVYLRVSYGHGLFNDGNYTVKNEFDKALRAFMEL